VCMLSATVAASRSCQWLPSRTHCKHAGANIESLAVGLNIDKALFTIVTTGNRSAIANLVKQLSKLVKVRYVEDITHAMRVERELVLFKVRAPPGPARTEVLQLVDIFRARVIDVSGAGGVHVLSLR